MSIEIRDFIVTALEEIKLGIDGARKELKDSAYVGYPEEVEFEIAIDQEGYVSDSDPRSTLKIRIPLSEFPAWEKQRMKKKDKE